MILEACTEGAISFDDTTELLFLGILVALVLIAIAIAATGRRR